METTSVLLWLSDMSTSIFLLVVNHVTLRKTASMEQRKFWASNKNQPCASAASFRPFLHPQNFLWPDFFNADFTGILWIASGIKFRKRCAEGWVKSCHSFEEPSSKSLKVEFASVLCSFPSLGCYNLRDGLCLFLYPKKIVGFLSPLHWMRGSSFF